MDSRFSSKGLSKTDIVLLSILMEKPAYGYEVEQAIVERHMRKWAAIGTSSIYSGLDRLEKKGLAKSELDTSQGLPARRVYSITPEGQVHLRDGAAILLRQGEYIYLDFNVGLAAYPYLELHNILSYARERRESLQALIDDAEQHHPDPSVPIPVHAFWLWKHEYDLLIAEVKWLEEFIQYVQEQVE